MKKFLLELRSPSRTGGSSSHHLLQVDNCHLGNNEGEDEGDSEDDHYHVIDSEYRLGRCDVSEKFNSLGLR